MKKPNMIVETFLSTLKYFLIFVIINNLIWAAVHFGYVNKSFGGSYDIAMSQNADGDNNNQSMNNGAAGNKN